MSVPEMTSTTIANDKKLPTIGLRRYKLFPSVYSDRLFLITVDTITFLLLYNDRDPLSLETAIIINFLLSFCKFK